MKSEKLSLNSLKVKSFATSTRVTQSKIKGGAQTFEQDCFTDDCYNDPTDQFSCYSLCTCYNFCAPEGKK